LDALVNDGELLGIQLPASMAFEITECAPSMKAASSSARTKPATLSTGLVVQVPEYLTPGEIIKVNTETREFVSRA
jgi:elongation factor P